jgi:hypothetical protein
VSQLAPRRVGDVVATGVLSLVHAALALYLLFLNLGIAMSTDPYAYLERGDERWIWVAMFMATCINGAVFFVGVCATIAVTGSRRRTAFIVPLIGCVGHVLLIVATIAVASLAGPAAEA